MYLGMFSINFSHNIGNGRYILFTNPNRSKNIQLYNIAVNITSIMCKVQYSNTLREFTHEIYTSQ